MNQVEHYAPAFLIKIKETELRHGVTVDVSSVSVTDNANQADSFTFTLRDRCPEPGRLFAGGKKLQWMDSKIFDEGSRVKIDMGYVNNLRPMLLGEITAVSPTFPANGQPTLTVQGRSLYDRLRHAYIRKPFKSSTDSDIACDIATAMKLNAEVDRTAAEHLLVSPNSDVATFLKQRAERIGYEVVVKEETLYFQRPRYLDNPHPALTLEWGKSLISFSPRLSTYNTVTKVTVRSPQTSLGRGKVPLVGTATAGDERVKMGTETGPEIARRIFGDQNVVIEDHNIASAEEANEVARSQLETRALNFITGRGSCSGNPAIRARMVIELNGLGERFSGSYYVTSATHTINNSGYRTDFEIKRNGR